MLLNLLEGGDEQIDVMQERTVFLVCSSLQHISASTPPIGTVFDGMHTRPGSIRVRQPDQNFT